MTTVSKPASQSQFAETGQHSLKLAKTGDILDTGQNNRLLPTAANGWYYRLVPF